MKGAVLTGSNMSSINLRVATLKNANLQDCDLRLAILAGADLEVRSRDWGHGTVTGVTGLEPT